MPADGQQHEQVGHSTNQRAGKHHLGALLKRGCGQGRGETAALLSAGLKWPGLDLRQDQ